MRIAISGCLLALCGASFVQAQEKHAWSAGVAKVDITPNYAVRLSGFGFRRTESEGVTQKIWAKALALRWHDEPPVVVLAVDNLGIPASMRAEVARRLQQKASLPPDRLAITASHTHTAPMLTNVAPTLFGVPIPPEHQRNIDRYTVALTDHLEQAARAALQDLKPARLAYGVGSAKFAINRRTKGGPIDHDLPLVAVYGQDDKLRALWVTYACHCVTLSNNKISGDWSGYAQAILEENHPGATALVSIGCGADQNPSSGVTGDKVDVCRAQGAEIAAEVRRLLGGMLTPVAGPVVARMKNLDLPLADLPTKEQWEEKAKQKGAVGYHAQVNLARLARGDKLPTKIDYSVQTWTFGDALAMVYLPGEVVVDYAVRLKQELDGRRLIVHAYANDAPCYIPSERVLKEGGYEGGFAMVYYDLPVPLRAGLEDKIVGAVKELVGKKFAAPFDAKKCATLPLSPQQSLATIQVRKGLKVELAVAEPLVTSPVAIDFGPSGELWVAEMYDYPLGITGNYEPGGRIKLLRSPSPLWGEGRVRGSGAPLYDTVAIFLDNIPFPTGVTAYKKGVLVCAAPDILYAEDTDGDGKADLVKKLFSGFGTGNYQGRVNSLVWSLDGWHYGSCGLFGGTIKSHTGQVVQLGDRDFRIKPDEGILEPATGRTQQGRVRDDWDNWFGCDNSTLCRHYPLADHYLRRNPHAAQTDVAVYVPDYPDSNRLFPIAKQQLFKLSGPAGRTTGACGLGIYRDDLLGNEFQGNAFVCEPVNNLVHRLVLTPKGSTFSGRRAADEQTSEFLAATDPWFRPVQAVTGPDGALWIVDMYRYVIEHPRWIPPEELAKHDLRAGSTMGRIYRVVPDKGHHRFPLLPLPESGGRPRWLSEMTPADLDTPRLVTALSSPSGWVRDQASQLVLFSHDPNAVLPLRKQLRDGRAETRLHALCILDSLDKLLDVQRAAALGDAHPGVRRHAIRITERRKEWADEVRANLAPRVNDSDPQVRLQLACTLGSWGDADAGKLLAQLPLEQSDRHFIAALASSFHSGNLAEVTSRVLKDQSAARTLLPAVANQVGAQGNAALVARFLDEVLPAGTARPSLARLRTAAVLFERVAPRWGKLVPEFPPALAKRIEGVLRAVRHLADDETAPEPERLAALQFFGHNPEWALAEMAVLKPLLSPQAPGAIQAAALQALGRFTDAYRSESISSPVVAAWKGLTPSVKSQALDLLLSRTVWQMELLDAIRTRKIAAGDLDAARRQRLVTSKDAKVAARAAEVFAGALASNRQQVIDSYRAATNATGNPARGQEVFRKHCAACHRLGQEGHQVGPDMTVALGKPREYLLIEILDPSRNLDSRYVEYLAVTDAGRSFTGVLATETSTSITLRGQEGKQQVLLRSELDSLASTGRSLMPEGFEKEVTPAAMADLLALLTGPPGPPPTPKTFAGNRPEVVTPRDGLLSLLATNAEIYGPAIVLEQEFKNLGYWHGEDDRAVWRVRLDKGGQFDVHLDYACAADSAGNRFVLDTAKAKLTGKIGATGGDWSNYRVVKIGTLELPAGEQRVVLRADGKPRGALADVRGILLVPAGTPLPAKAPLPRMEIAEVARQLLDDSLASAKRQALVDDHVGRAAELLAAMTADLEPGTKEEYRRIPWIWRVAIAAGKRNDAVLLRGLLEVSLPKPGQPLRDWEAVVLGGGVINGVSLAGAWPGRRIEQALGSDGRLAQRWRTALAQAAQMADDPKVPTGTRYDALRMIALVAWDKAGPHLARYLPKDVHSELQMGAVSALADIEDAGAAKLLVEHLAGLTPGNRKLAVDGLLKTGARAELLLAALEDGLARAEWLGADQRKQLSESATLKERARKLFAP